MAAGDRFQHNLAALGGSVAFPQLDLSASFSRPSPDPATPAVQYNGRFRQPDQAVACFSCSCLVLALLLRRLTRVPVVRLSCACLVIGSEGECECVREADWMTGLVRPSHRGTPRCADFLLHPLLVKASSRRRWRTAANGPRSRAYRHRRMGKPRNTER